MTLEEKLGCLDGDAPFWPGLTDMSGGGGYYLHPWPAAVVERLGIPGIEFADGPRGCVIGDATAFPVSMARGATFDPDLEERIGEAIGRRTPGERRDVHRRRVHEPAPSSRVGSRPGDLRRGSAPRRGDGGRVHPRPAASRDGVHEALRLELDGERPVHRRRHRRRACAPRGVPAALRAGRRRRCRLGDERLQLGERRVVRSERDAPDRHPPRGVGLGRVRGLRLHLRAA